MIDPIALRLGPIEVHWYGIAIAAAALSGAVIGSLEARRRGENPEHAWAMLLWVLIAGIAGARLYHVIHLWDFYSQDPALIPQVWRGGLGIPGGIAGGALAVVVYARINRLVATRWLDIVAPAMLVGQAIGRFGNFVNQELYGPPTTLPWGIPIDEPHRVGDWVDLARYPVETTRFHPLFAYEAILNLIGALVLLYVARRFAAWLYDGDIVLLYFVWYGSVRTLLEPLRTDNWFIGPLPAAVWFGLLAVVAAAALLVVRHRKGWGTPGAWMRRADDPGGEAVPATPAASPEPG